MAATTASQANAYYTKLIGYPVRVTRPRGNVRWNIPTTTADNQGVMVRVPAAMDYLDKQVERVVLNRHELMKELNSKPQIVTSNQDVAKFYKNKYGIQFTVRRGSHFGLAFMGHAIILTLYPSQDGIDQKSQDSVDKILAPMVDKLKRPVMITADEIKALTHKYARKIGVDDKIRSIGFVGTDASRWGVCSADGNIRYNKWLMYVPPEVAESTVVHEVAHLVEFNHGPKFQALVRQMMPDYDVQDARLREIEKDPFGMDTKSIVTRSYQKGIRDGRKAAYRIRIAQRHGTPT